MPGWHELEAFADKGSITSADDGSTRVTAFGKEAQICDKHLCRGVGIVASRCHTRHIHCISVEAFWRDRIVVDQSATADRSARHGDLRAAYLARKDDSERNTDDGMPQ